MKEGILCDNQVRLVLCCPRKGAGDFLIAADKGYEALEAYGAPPDLVVGDFDSLGRRPNHPNVIQLPVMKDDTDMVYALREGLERGYRRFVLLGGVGGHRGHRPAQRVHDLPPGAAGLPVRVLLQRRGQGGSAGEFEV